MPRYGQPGAAAPATTGRYANRPQTAAPPRVSDGGVDPLAVGAGALALGAGALALKKPQLLGKIADTALAARYIPMLSGFAVPKSMLGNVGAAIASSAERRSMAPLKEFFSSKTAADFMRELRTPTARGSGQVASQAGKYNPFGRLMGAADEATQRALVRSGLTRAKAAEHTLQTPLPSQMAKPLGTRLGRYVVPFQRTPWNQFIQTFKASSEHPGIAAASAAAGAATGATSEDVITPGLAAPLTGRYSGPFLAGAIAGRALSGGKDAARVGYGVSPTSDTTITDPILSPGKAFVRPSVLSMLRYFGVTD